MFGCSSSISVCRVRPRSSRSAHPSPPPPARSFRSGTFSGPHSYQHSRMASNARCLACLALIALVGCSDETDRTTPEAAGSPTVEIAGVTLVRPEPEVRDQCRSLAERVGYPLLCPRLLPQYATPYWGRPTGNDEFFQPGIGRLRRWVWLSVNLGIAPSRMTISSSPPHRPGSTRDISSSRQSHTPRSPSTRRAAPGSGDVRRSGSTSVEAKASTSATPSWSGQSEDARTVSASTAKAKKAASLASPLRGVSHSHPSPPPPSRKPSRPGPAWN
jgi:hypothetical protein